MLNFTFVPVWVIEDLLIYLATLATIFYIVKREPHPVARLMEMFAFATLDSAAYENFATTQPHFYEYGRSLIMIFNVPLSVPLFEYLVLYAALKLFERTRMPTWLKPLGAGFLAVVADFTLDPVSVQQRFHTLEGTIGRWTWYPLPGDVQIYTEPVKNFTGWMLIVGYAATAVLLGRAWHRRTGFSSLVGYLYPVLGAIVALVVLVTPLSLFFLNLAPFFAAGSNGEWVMLLVMLLLPPVLLAVLWRGKMQGRYSLKDDLPIFFVLGGFPVVNVIFTLIGGYMKILWLELLFFAVMELMLAWFLLAARRADVGNGREEMPVVTAIPDRVARPVAEVGTGG
jgi:hypothetical protein